MKNKFFNIITALLLTLTLVCHGAFTFNTSMTETEISVCTADPSEDDLDGDNDTKPILP